MKCPKCNGNISNIPTNAIIIEKGISRIPGKKWVKYVLPGKPHYRYIVEDLVIE